MSGKGFEKRLEKPKPKESRPAYGRKDREAIEE